MINTSHRYALAFFELCKDNDWLDIVYHDLRSIDHMLVVSDDLNDLCSSPLYNEGQKMEVFRKIFENKIDSTTFQLLKFMGEKKHLYLLKEIITHFLELYRTYKNIQKITIFSSQYLAQDLVDKICQQLQVKLNKTIEYDSVIDLKLIGGLKISVGDTVYDFSFKNQLDRFKQKLLTAA